MDLNLSPWILLIAPLTAAILGGLFFRRAGTVASAISVLSVLLTLLVTVSLLSNPKQAEPFTWIDIAGFQVQFGLKVDSLSIGMMFVVTFIGTLVHLFSLSYMATDEGKGRYFAGLALFMFSMTGIVLADNFVMMFVFWELVGVSSYILIGHYFTKNSAAEASKKAFLVNRIGDFGFMIGILMVWALTGSVIFTEIGQEVLDSKVAVPVLTIATLCIFLGAVGKSAQVPLHVWLPDAMEGPTPVSALIHAATMVAAGVYMLVRVQFDCGLITESDAGPWIAWIGGGTALFAALCAIQQNDIKRILAFSTLSQLGYMVMAVGLHAFDEAMFHLYTHAFFKALLFLGAGAIIHMAHHEQDIWKMGGIGLKMPTTLATFFFGTAALVAFPGTSGYFSKESILHAAHEVNLPLFWMAVCVAGLTAFYMTRLFIVVFMGKPRSKNARHADDAPILMRVVLIMLAMLSIFSAYSFVAKPLNALVPIIEAHGDEQHGLSVPAISMIALSLGVILAILIYRGKTKDPVRIAIFEHKFWIDEIYGGVVRIGQDLTANILYAVDQLLIGGALVTGSAKLTEGVGKALRRIQSGNISAYGLVVALGVIVLLTLILNR